jgi:hypothetical protein
MILLDTDHLTLIKYVESERGRGLADRLRALPVAEVVGIAIVSVEEQMRGWLAAIAKERQVIRQVPAYGALMASSSISESTPSFRSTNGRQRISTNSGLQRFGSGPWT